MVCLAIHFRRERTARRMREGRAERCFFSWLPPGVGGLERNGGEGFREECLCAVIYPSFTNDNRKKLPQNCEEGIDNRANRFPPVAPPHAPTCARAFHAKPARSRTRWRAPAPAPAHILETRREQPPRGYQDIVSRGIPNSPHLSS